MIKRIGSYLASRPERAAMIVLTLTLVLILVLAGVALQWLHIGRAPYPSEDTPLSLVDDVVVWSQDQTDVVSWEDAYVPFNYSGMKIAFQIDWGGGGVRTVNPFGNQSLLSAHSSTTIHQSVSEASYGNVSIDITDSTGDGSFNIGDSIVFEIVPLSEDTIYTVGLYFLHAFGMSMSMELSFAIHDGKFYSWNSRYLPTDHPWYDDSFLIEIRRKMSGWLQVQIPEE